MRTPLIIFIIFSFIFNTLTPIPVRADDIRLPVPGTMVHLSPPENPPVLKGITVYQNNPFKFDFILDKGDTFSKKMSSPNNKELSSPNASVGDPYQEQLKQESTKLVKYFLASITTPENDLWVNLSPYEKNRIIPESFGQTDMGRDLLAEDYILKQITASLIYPESSIGKKFWKQIYEEAQKKYGTTNIPINTFNKVWIIPDQTKVYEHGNTAFVVKASLKVMLEQDYLSLEKHSGVSGEWLMVKNRTKTQQIQLPLTINQLGSQIIHELIIPELTKEVNQGQNFATLRQVYYSLILAVWFKKHMKDSLLGQKYMDQNKVEGIKYGIPPLFYKEGVRGSSIRSQQNLSPDQIYQLYLKAFKKGVYNYIKDDPIDVSKGPIVSTSNSFTSLRGTSEASDEAISNRTTIPRKYFSGGWSGLTKPIYEQAMLPNEVPKSNNFAQVSVNLNTAQSTKPNPVVVAKLKRAERKLKIKFKRKIPMELSSFQHLKEIGTGRSSKVYRDPDNPANFYKVFYGKYNQYGIDELRNLKIIKNIRGVPKVLGWGATDDGGIWIHMKGIQNATSLVDYFNQYGGNKFGQISPEAWNRFSFLWRLDKLARVAEILYTAHQRGISHNDVRPTNIIVNDQGEVMVIDWDISKALGQRQSDGSAGYEAPEKIKRDQSDVYSLQKTMVFFLPPHDPLNTSKVIKDLDDLRQRMNKEDPNQRPAMKQVAKELRKLATRAAATQAMSATEKQFSHEFGTAYTGLLSKIQALALDNPSAKPLESEFIQHIRMPFMVFQLGPKELLVFLIQMQEALEGVRLEVQQTDYLNEEQKGMVNDGIRKLMEIVEKFNNGGPSTSTANAAQAMNVENYSRDIQEGLKEVIKGSQELNPGNNNLERLLTLRPGTEHSLRVAIFVYHLTLNRWALVDRKLALQRAVFMFQVALLLNIHPNRVVPSLDDLSILSNEMHWTPEEYWEARLIINPIQEREQVIDILGHIYRPDDTTGEELTFALGAAYLMQEYAQQGDEFFNLDFKDSLQLVEARNTGDVKSREKQTAQTYNDLLSKIGTQDNRWFKVFRQMLSWIHQEERFAPIKNKLEAFEFPELNEATRWMTLDNLRHLDANQAGYRTIRDGYNGENFNEAKQKAIKASQKDYLTRESAFSHRLGNGATPFSTFLQLFNEMAPGKAGDVLKEFQKIINRLDKFRGYVTNARTKNDANAEIDSQKAKNEYPGFVIQTLKALQDLSNMNQFKELSKNEQANAFLSENFTKGVTVSQQMEKLIGIVNYFADELDFNDHLNVWLQEFRFINLNPFVRYMGRQIHIELETSKDKEARKITSTYGLALGRSPNLTIEIPGYLPNKSQYQQIVPMLMREIAGKNANINMIYHGQTPILKREFIYMLRREIDVLSEQFNTTGKAQSRAGSIGLNNNPLRFRMMRVVKARQRTLQERVNRVISRIGFSQGKIAVLSARPANQKVSVDDFIWYMYQWFNQFEFIGANPFEKQIIYVGFRTSIENDVTFEGPILGASEGYFYIEIPEYFSTNKDFQKLVPRLREEITGKDSGIDKIFSGQTLVSKEKFLYLLQREIDELFKHVGETGQVGVPGSIKLTSALLKYRLMHGFSAGVRVLRKSSHSNQAMTGPGGIDLTSKRMKLEIDSDKAAKSQLMDVKAMEHIIINGLYIKDIEVKPLKNLTKLLGVSSG